MTFVLDEVLLKYKLPILVLLGGVILIGAGAFVYKSDITKSTKVEILTGENTASESGRPLTVEIAGEVINPGVYHLATDSRVDDLLIVANGFSSDADRDWTDKYLNRAAKLTDGQKVFVPSTDKQTLAASAKIGDGDQSGSLTISSDSSESININTAGLSELTTMPGIGQVYGQSIIDHRPYSTTQELVSKGAIRQSLYDKIKDMVSVY